MSETAQWFLAFAGFAATGAYWACWFLLFDTPLSWGLVGIMIGVAGFWLAAAAAVLFIDWARKNGARV